MEPARGFWAVLADDERAVLTDLGRIAVYPPGRLRAPKVTAFVDHLAARIGKTLAGTSDA